MLIYKFILFTDLLTLPCDQDRARCFFTKPNSDYKEEIFLEGAFNGSKRCTASDRMFSNESDSSWNGKETIHLPKLSLLQIEENIFRKIASLLQRLDAGWTAPNSPILFIKNSSALQNKKRTG